jgi:hypothetical protein
MLLGIDSHICCNPLPDDGSTADTLDLVCCWTPFIHTENVERERGQEGKESKKRKEREGFDSGNVSKKKKTRLITKLSLCTRHSVCRKRSIIKGNEYFWNFQMNGHCDELQLLSKWEICCML